MRYNYLRYTYPELVQEEKNIRWKLKMGKTVRSHREKLITLDCMMRDLIRDDMSLCYECVPVCQISI